MGIDRVIGAPPMLKTPTAVRSIGTHAACECAGTNTTADSLNYQQRKTSIKLLNSLNEIYMNNSSINKSGARFRKGHFDSL